MLARLKTTMKKLHGRILSRNHPAPLSVKETIPAIFFNTMPKSGSVFILHTLENGLDVPFINVSGGYFPDDLIQRAEFSRFAQGNAVTQCHVPPHPINLGQIRHYVGKMVLHVRDPRQAVLSWTHHIQRFRDDKSALCVHYPYIPDEYFDWGLAARIDWQIENYAPGLIKWVEDWADYIDAGAAGCEILVTRYESFLEDKEAFFKNILAFYGVDEKDFVLPNVERNEKTNFRKGTSDEWRSVFSDAQSRKLDAMMGDSVRKLCLLDEKLWNTNSI